MPLQAFVTNRKWYILKSDLYEERQDLSYLCCGISKRLLKNDYVGDFIIPAVFAGYSSFWLAVALTDVAWFDRSTVHFFPKQLKNILKFDGLKICGT